MAGIYIHVPFCTTRCIYCDFFSQTDMHYKPDFVKAVACELAARKDYLGNEPVSTVYFGGGTPSRLQAADFDAIFDAIYQHYKVLPDAEITLEANPDDISAAYINSLTALPFNRISVGVQSFDDNDLQMLHRRHTSRQAIDAIGHCRDSGFLNISIDLMYGLPGQTTEKWEINLLEAIRLDIPHISAYHLTYEPETRIHRQLLDGIVCPVNEETSESLFYTLINVLMQAGYRHYEISNFCKPGMFSRHNAAYWNGTKYLGVGPAAHSYDGVSRQWNVASLSEYIQGIISKSTVFEKETLDVQTQYNEYVMTRLRTQQGILLSDLQKEFAPEYTDYFIDRAASLIRQGLLAKTTDAIRIPHEKWFVSDAILRSLIK